MVAALVMLKQIIILTHINNPAAAQHVRELLIKSKKKCISLKGNIIELNMGQGTNGLLVFSGTRGRRYLSLPMEGIQGNSRQGICVKIRLL